MKDHLSLIKLIEFMSRLYKKEIDLSHKENDISNYRLNSYQNINRLMVAEFTLPEAGNKNSRELLQCVAAWRKWHRLWNVTPRESRCS